MIPLSPAFLIAGANAFIGLGEHATAIHRHLADVFLREVKLPPGRPWCTAFVHHVGYWSHYDERQKASSWPLPPSASCAELADFARTSGLLETTPLIGDVFLLWSHTLKQFAHTGIVIEVTAVTRTLTGTRSVNCTTIEGNSEDDDGQREDAYTVRRSRRLVPTAGDRFIRWAHADVGELSAKHERVRVSRAAARTAA